MQRWYSSFHRTDEELEAQRGQEARLETHSWEAAMSGSESQQPGRRMVRKWGGKWAVPLESLIQLLALGQSWCRGLGAWKREEEGAGSSLLLDPLWAAAQVLPQGFYLMIKQAQRRVWCARATQHLVQVTWSLPWKPRGPWNGLSGQ